MERKREREIRTDRHTERETDRDRQAKTQRQRNTIIYKKKYVVEIHNEVCISFLFARRIKKKLTEMVNTKSAELIIYAG